jgi:probable rRNA maturation factor
LSVFGSDEQTVVAIDLPHWLALARFALVEERVPLDAELSVIFVDEQTISDLNTRFLGHPGPTDVLAFPIDEDPLPGGRRPDEGGRGPGSGADADEPPIVLGDVIVCPAIAARQAAEHHHGVDDELALLVVHGVLHLLRYDHGDGEDAERMQRRERELLDGFRRERAKSEP